MNGWIAFQEGQVVFLGQLLHHNFPQAPSCHWSSLLERLSFKFNIYSGKKEKEEKINKKNKWNGIHQVRHLKILCVNVYFW